jgi:hypothetical protein
MTVPVLIVMSDCTTSGLLIVAGNLQRTFYNAFNDSYPGIIAERGAVGSGPGIWDQHFYSLWSCLYEGGLNQVDED